MLLNRRRALGGMAALGAALGLPGCSARASAPVLRYGDHPAQVGELHLPPAPGPARGVVVVVHGGFWRSTYGLDLGTPLAADLAAAGVVAWNVEYRRVGGEGGWPATFADAAAAVDALADVVQSAAPGRLDLDRVVAVGHSAGGHLAAWLAARPGLPAGSPGAVPRVRLRGAVSQAGVLDLVDAAGQGVGGAAVRDLMGGSPDQKADRYRLGSPAARVPLGVPVVCVHGTLDTIVPIRQSERYVAAARAAGDPAELVRLDGADHFAVIDPASSAWATCRDAALRLLS